MEHYLTLAVDSRNDLNCFLHLIHCSLITRLRAVKTGLFVCLLYALIQWQTTTTYGPDLKPSEVNWNVSSAFIRLWIGSEVQQFTQLRSINYRHKKQIICELLDY